MAYISNSPYLNLPMCIGKDDHSYSDLLDVVSTSDSTLLSSKRNVCNITWCSIHIYVQVMINLRSSKYFRSHEAVVRICMLPTDGVTACTRDPSKT